MSEPKFTPGPWLRDRFGVIQDSEYFRQIASAVCSAEVDEEARDANAHLIAAAPELFGLLARAEEELRLIRWKDSDAVYDVTLRTEIHAILAKARGAS